jgi:hypothetical protein
MTNLQLIVMIAAYCGAREFDTFKDTDTYNRQTKQLINNGMIKPASNYQSNNFYKFECTDKGKAWLDHVLAIPYPIEVRSWRIPKCVS